jgi:hypothetical protein
MILLRPFIRIAALLGIIPVAVLCVIAIPFIGYTRADKITDWYMEKTDKLIE